LLELLLLLVRSRRELLKVRAVRALDDELLVAAVDVAVAVVVALAVVDDL
jgi:hypothetical protein